MQNSISFVNEQLCWEEQIPHRHDCHDPPHAARVGLHDDKSPPRRLAAVARSDPWKTTPAQVGFPGDQLGDKDCSGLGGQAAATWAGVRITCGGIAVAKTAIPSGIFVQSFGLQAGQDRTCSFEASSWSQEDLASFRNRARTSSWSFWFNFLKVSMTLPSRKSGAALTLHGDKFRFPIAFIEKLVCFDLKGLCQPFKCFEAGHSVPVLDP